MRLKFCVQVLAALLVHSQAHATEKERFCEPKIFDEKVVASAIARLEASKSATVEPPLEPGRTFAWPDTPFGMTRSGKQYYFFASDGASHTPTERGATRGGSVVRTTGTLDNPLGQGVPLEVSVHGNDNTTVDPEYSQYEYLGGGPVLQVPAKMYGNGHLLMVTHAEIVTPKTLPKPGFYSVLGLAASTDYGKSWTDIGPVVRTNHPFQNGMDSFDIGDPPLTVGLDGNVYLYFQDWIGDDYRSHGHSTTVSVARASLSSVLSAAFDAKPQSPKFFKFYKGVWGEPALGGRSSDLNMGVAFGDERQVTYSRFLRHFIMIMGGGSIIAYSEAEDGLAWRRPKILKDLRKDGHATYVTVVDESGQTTAVGSRFYVFYTWYPTTGGWSEAEVRRFTVDCR